MRFLIGILSTMSVLFPVIKDSILVGSLQKNYRFYYRIIAFLLKKHQKHPRVSPNSQYFKISLRLYNSMDGHKIQFNNAI